MRHPAPALHIDENFIFEPRSAGRLRGPRPYVASAFPRRAVRLSAGNRQRRRRPSCRREARIGAVFALRPRPKRARMSGTRGSFMPSLRTGPPGYASAALAYVAPQFGELLAQRLIAGLRRVEILRARRRHLARSRRVLRISRRLGGRGLFGDERGEIAARIDPTAARLPAISRRRLPTTPVRSPQGPPGRPGRASAGRRLDVEAVFVGALQPSEQLILPLRVQFAVGDPERRVIAVGIEGGDRLMLLAQTPPPLTRAAPLS